MLHLLPHSAVHNVACFLESVHNLSHLCTVNRDFHANLRAKEMWLRVAQNTTGYSTIPFNIESPDFWYKLRLLVCPWMSVHVRLSDIPPVAATQCEPVCIYLNDTELVFHGAFHGIFSYETKRMVHPARESGVWTSVPPPLQLRDGGCNIFRAWSFRLVTKKIHKSATALINLNEGNISFISARGKVNACFVLGIHCLTYEVDITSAPCEIWVLHNLKVMYFGPREDRLLNTADHHLPCQLCSNICQGDASLSCPLCSRAVDAKNASILEEVAKVLGINNGLHF